MCVCIYICACRCHVYRYTHELPPTTIHTFFTTERISLGSGTLSPTPCRAVCALFFWCLPIVPGPDGLLLLRLVQFRDLAASQGKAGTQSIEGQPRRSKKQWQAQTRTKEHKHQTNYAAPRHYPAKGRHVANLHMSMVVQALGFAPTSSVHQTCVQNNKD